MESKKNKIITLENSQTESLFAGIRELSTEEIIIIDSGESQELENKLKEYQVKTKKLKIKQIGWENIFRLIKELKQTENNLIINVATGNPTTTAMMTSAAFVNGIMAYSVEDGKLIMLPVLKFSYYKMIPDKKMQIIRLLHAKKHCCSSLENLSKEMDMSLPLISYHINGTKKSRGLKELGLVETKESKGKVGVSLSLQGILIAEGHIQSF